MRNAISGWNAFESSANAFVKLSPGTTVAQVEKQFPAFFKLHETSIGDTKGGLKLQPLSDIHFNSAFGDDYGRRAHKPTLYALAGIALFIPLDRGHQLCETCSISRPVLRAREVGVRKVLGSSRAGLIWQFLGETGIIVLASMVLALLLADPVIAVLHGDLRSGPSSRKGVRVSDGRSQYLALHRPDDNDHLPAGRMVSRADLVVLPAGDRPAGPG